MKLKSKTQYRIGISLMVIPFISFMLSLFSLIFTAEKASENISFYFLAFSMIAMVLGSIIGFFISKPVSKREERLKSQRQKIYTNICIDAIFDGNYEKVEFIFDKCLRNHNDRLFISGLCHGMIMNDGITNDERERSKEIILSFKYEL